MKLQFDRTLKASDLLTSITILISVATLTLSFAKDRAAQAHEQANKVRAAAATTLAKLDRWQQVQLSLYQALQPNFVQLSEDLAKQYNVVAIRDQFWKQTELARAQISKNVLEEHLHTSYAELITHFPAARAQVTQVLTALDVVENTASAEFMFQAEKSILSFKEQKLTYQTPQLGNALRLAAANGAMRLKTESDRLLDPVRQYLFSLITRSDKELVFANK